MYCDIDELRRASESRSAQQMELERKVTVTNLVELLSDVEPIT